MCLIRYTIMYLNGKHVFVSHSNNNKGYSNVVEWPNI